MVLRLLRDPLFTFVLLGTIVFASYQFFENDTTRIVQLNDATKNRLISDFEQLTGREITQADKVNIEREYIDGEILFREAIANGMHLIVPEVRNKLVEEMRYQITGMLPDPDEQQLIDYYLNNIERYFREPTVTFEHIYFQQRPLNPDELLENLNQGNTFLGDEFSQGNRFPNYGNSMLRGMFGQEFLSKLHQFPTGQWLGPEKSPAGWHYLYIFNRRSKVPLSFDEARIQVENDLMQWTLQQAVSERIQELEKKYQVTRFEHN